MTELKSLQINLKTPRYSKDKKTRYFPIEDNGKRVFYTFTNVLTASKAKMADESTFATVCFKQEDINQTTYTTKQKIKILANTDCFLTQLKEIDRVYREVWVPELLTYIKSNTTQIFSIRQTHAKNEEDAEPIELSEHLYRLKIKDGKYLNLRTKKVVDGSVEELADVLKRHSLIAGQLQVDCIIVSKFGISLDLKLRNLAVYGSDVVYNPYSNIEKEFDEFIAIEEPTPLTE